MKCASCSAPLEIKPETTEFVCAYCGSAQIVDRSGGTVTLNLVAETLGKVQQGTDRTASELALVRLKKELQHLPYPDLYLEPPRPVKPEFERPKFHLLDFVGSLLSWDALGAYKFEKKIRNDSWADFDREVAAYNTEMVNWPTRAIHNEILMSEFVKRQQRIAAEIAIHEAIVKRS